MSTDAPADRRFMQMALDVCRAGLAKGQSPFGACIVRHAGPGEAAVLACTHNHVRLNCDATAHAEVQAIRQACQAANDIHLPDTTIYSTTEPCPMCFTAIHWARIGRIVFGASVEDAATFGFHELPISNAQLKTLGHSNLVITGGFMRDEALDLFRQWQQAGGKPY